MLRRARRRERRSRAVRLAAAAQRAGRGLADASTPSGGCAPLARIARERGALPRGGDRARSSACASASRELCGPAGAAGAPARRSVVGQRDGRREGRPWLIDPSAYGGHREVDLAMLRLFGAPSRARVRAPMRSCAPLADGWRERVELYQLLPLLVHALLFGGSYRAAAERVARATPATRAERCGRRPRPARRRGGRSGRCAPATRSPHASGCICSRAWSSRATTAAQLTLAVVARALASSPRQLQRAYAQFGESTFQRGSARAADGRRRRELLVEQRAIPVRGRRPPGRLSPGAALRARVPPPLRPVARALSRARRFTPGE